MTKGAKAAGWILGGIAPVRFGRRGRYPAAFNFKHAAFAAMVRGWQRRQRYLFETRSSGW